MKKRLIILSGAGISAESGIKTFRDSGGLWENYPVEEVASIGGWHRNPELMLRFYNERRASLEHAQPNDGHRGLADLEKNFDVHIITQNVDNLHERAGSTNVLHLHGELTKACNTSKTQVIDIGYRAITLGEKADDGLQLRPFIVWFGEAVPMMEPAVNLVETADIFVVIGTSLNVYPAAGLLGYVPRGVPVYLIDPNEVPVGRGDVRFIKKGASEGVKELKKLLL